MFIFARKCGYGTCKIFYFLCKVLLFNFSHSSYTYTTFKTCTTITYTTTVHKLPKQHYYKKEK